MDQRAIVRALTEVAETAAETLDLQEVFDRVASSIRTVLPFDHMGVVRIVDGDRAVLHATTVPCETGEHACSGPMTLSAWSPRLRPVPGPKRRIDDAYEELDADFPVDRDILSAGVRSTLWEPFRPAEELRGGVWLSAFEPAAFTDQHQEILGPFAALLGSAVDHWRIWDVERRRRERLDRLEVLFGTLAEALDVREVFERISQAVQPVLPHDVLILTELDDHDRNTFRLVATAGKDKATVPSERFRLTPEELASRSREFEILRDLPVELTPDTERNRKVIKSGMRSWLRVPVRRWGEVRGSLVFLDREPAQFAEEDVEVARRIADRIALALSHHRLAEEARIAAEACERARALEATVATLTRELEARGQNRIIGVSRSWKEVLLQVGRVAASETTALITGESGTGKEVVSRLIHQGSPRAKKPFVAINCAALPEQFLESELFGHEKGAFTGAVATKVGRIEQAAGGTLFLDEIAEMSPLLQAKLLRVLQERELQRLGGTKTIRVDVRVVAATNRDLTAAMARGQFREDLYYRLNVFEIRVPALRERREDILPLAESFLEELAPTMPRPAAGISRDAREWLLAYAWPGNVRELRNAIERAILLCDGGLITREHLPAVIGRPEQARSRNGNGSSLDAHLDPEAPLPPGGVDLDDVERDYVQKALDQTRGNKAKAARLLGLTRSQLYTRLEKYGMR